MVPASPDAQAVLDFWFGDGLTLGWPSASRSDLWFGGGAELDRQIEQTFGNQVRTAVDGGWVDWEAQPAERLALIILLDQFTRNVFRGSALAFSGDPRACALARDAWDRHWDRDMPLVAQVFLAMPLMHAESLAMQDLCVTRFERLLAESPDAMGEKLQGHLDAAHEHRAIIAAFGRYPHRNTVLGRVSTDAELEWLRNGKRFGQ
jgi:uncharacterized protein (DUF924 family)